MKRNNHWAVIGTAALLSAAIAVSAQAAGFTAVRQTMYVAASALNVRAEPSLSGAVRGELYRGEAVKVTGLDGEWARIELNGSSSYVARRYLTETVPAAGTASTAGAGATEGAAAELPAGVTVSEITLTGGLRYAEFSKIHSGAAQLYRNTKGAHGDIVIAVNAGHGTKGGASVKTQSHPDGSGKVTGGTNAHGMVQSMAVSSGMDFADGTPEHVVNLKEAQLLKKKLLARGYSVLMIREGSDVQLDNIARTVLANNYASCHVAIHWDATSSDKGAFFMSVPDALKSMEPVASTWQKSERFGAELIAGLKGRGVRIYGDGTMDMDLTQTSYSTVPSVDIELGDKVSDHGAGTLDTLAEGLADGIEQYFK